MRFVSFFAGIGGFDLGLERAGHECVGQVEIDPYALRVLERHWPDVPRFGDVRTLDPYALPDADLWCGGFPCQPFSVAGARQGTDDERDLWPAWFRLIARRRPRWIFGENVPGLLSAEGGTAWGRIVRDLASVGYVGEWTVLGARDVGAPHRRDRLWIVARLPDAELHPERKHEHRETNTDTYAPRHGAHGAMADGDGRGREIGGLEEHADERGASGRESDRRGAGGRRDRAHVADAESTDDTKHSRGSREVQSRGNSPLDRRHQECWCGRGEPWCCDPADANGPGLEKREGPNAGGTGPDAGAVARRNTRRPAQPRVGRVAHGVRNRVDRLRCLGNSVVPQVVEAIARRVWPQ